MCFIWFLPKLTAAPGFETSLKDYCDIYSFLQGIFSIVCSDPVGWSRFLAFGRLEQASSCFRTRAWVDSQSLFFCLCSGALCQKYMEIASHGAIKGPLFCLCSRIRWRTDFFMDTGRVFQ
jgi:hypothetical protein